MNSSSDSHAQMRNVGRRLLAHWQLKLVAIPVFVTAFFVAYFALLRFPIFPVTEMPVMALDRMIPYQPWTLAAYYSLWGYVSLGPALMDRRSQLFAYTKMAAAMSMVGLGIFLFWPTAVPLGAGLTDTDSAALTWLKEVDAAGNACPSLHVAFAVFSALWLWRIMAEIRLPLALHLVNAAWCVAITYSTMATKQHVVTDVVAGAILGGIAGWMKLPEIGQPAAAPVTRSVERTSG